jgi:hypothetical protein
MKYYSVLQHSLQFQVKKEDLITVATDMLSEHIPLKVKASTSVTLVESFTAIFR